ncbi:MAG TPA: HypC/HybG/HupF family hydrogenase formation chaperone [Candidatus Hydrogenedens sp.]|nr:HypC/HybG/HupF family hydrogenase formation chaperone [Candidatus Hydrogenedens sp.]HOK09114.1 HypC/HybG/HupF family hydrogenase formation chaperone [Candidatus Hydrogenedens sp.]HOL20530.1 HypC/HybG/HupF family hydrogenase formation chaperone [Candidatus Hydrogenedens sp.]HPP58822.1 HypC/HybG/HupF family hydrogenase formation chaperone [Candidatus Hydrogenedens sp.]
MCLAIPGKIISIDHSDPTLRMAKVQFGGVIKEISLALTPEACEGMYVLVHAGLAINIVDEDEAKMILAEFENVDVSESEG